MWMLWLLVMRMLLGKTTNIRLLLLFGLVETARQTASLDLLDFFEGLELVRSGIVRISFLF